MTAKSNETFEKKVNKNFVSELDVFLSELHESTPLSESQQKEIDKHTRIFKMRDTPTAHASPKSNAPWDVFED